MKLYCYVDETGQDTRGELFIVAVVVSGANRDTLIAKLEQIERRSGKGRVKWTKVRGRQRMDYIQSVLDSPVFHGTLYFSVYRGSKSYMALTVLSTAKAILSAARQPEATTVFVDGLPKSRLRWFGIELRHLSIRNIRVSGIRREEADSLMCLADAVAGFVRAALSDQWPGLAELFAQAKRTGHVIEV